MNRFQRAAQLSHPQCDITRKLNTEKRIADYNANPSLCVVCSKPLTYIQNKIGGRFCSKRCWHDLRKKEAKITGVRKKVKTQAQPRPMGKVKIRNMLIEEAGGKCPGCGFDKVREDGRSVLEVDHIDGNHLNNDRSNLRILCPNCHSLTPNFRNWNNKGNKRRSTREYRRLHSV